MVQVLFIFLLIVFCILMYVRIKLLSKIEDTGKIKDNYDLDLKSERDTKPLEGGFATIIDCDNHYDKLLKQDHTLRKIIIFFGWSLAIFAGVLFFLRIFNKL
jgi:hypothetical protein